MCLVGAFDGDFYNLYVLKDEGEFIRNQFYFREDFALDICVTVGYDDANVKDKIFNNGGLNYGKRNEAASEGHGAGL